MASPITAVRFHSTKADGTDNAGGKVYTYAAGTTTPQVTYQDAAGLIPNSNPVILDGTGRAFIYINATLSYKFVCQDSAGATVPDGTVDNITDGSAGSALAANLANTSDPSKGAGQIGFNLALNYAAGTLGAHSRAYINVLDYMTQAELTDWLTGSPTLDHTAAINRATLSTLPFTGNADAPKRQVLLPGGNWNIAGPVYVRKGQELTGDGSGSTRITQDPSATTSIFRMGYGVISGTPTQDPGGLPPVICNLHINSSSSTAAAVDTGGAAGWLVHDIFFTNVGVGISASGSDGIIDRCFFDLGLNGIVLANMQNAIISNCLFYLMNYGITLGSNLYDIQIENCHCEYQQYASILFNDAATSIRNVSITDCQFLLNVQHATFLGFIHIRTGDADAVIADCKFRNMKGYAITHGTGVGGKFVVKDCTFDGAKTNPAYAQSTTAGGVLTANETMQLVDCDFLNLNVFGVSFTGTLASTLSIGGGSYSAISGATLVNIDNTSTSSKFTATGIRGDGVTPLVNAQDAVPVKTRNNVLWLGAAATGSSRVGVKVPFQYANQWMVTVRANALPGGNVNYRKTSSFMVQKENGFSGAARQTLTKATLLQTAADGVLPAIDIQIDLGSIGGGSTVAGHSLSGYAFFTVPDSYANVEFDVEPVV